jgi:hypothetical protein
VVSSYNAANRTDSAVHDINDRAYNKTASITDALDPDMLSSGLQGPHQDSQDTDNLLDKSSYAPAAEYLQQAGEKGHSISIGPATGSNEFGTRPLEPSERSVAENYTISTVLTTRFGSLGPPSFIDTT